MLLLGATHPAALPPQPQSSDPRDAPCPVYGINMESRPDRWSAMVLSAARAGLRDTRFHRWPGPNLKQMPRAEANALVSDAVNRSWFGKPAQHTNWGNLGLALAHFSLWAALASSLGDEEVVLIFEDDIQFKNTSFQGARDIMRALPRFDIVNLQANRAFGVPHDKRLGLFCVHQHHSDACQNSWLSSYLLSGAGARR